MNGPIAFGRVPVIRGREPNAQAIKLVEDALERLKRGDLINVAVVAERCDGEMHAAFACDPTEAIKLRGGLAYAGTSLDLKLLGKG